MTLKFFLNTFINLLWILQVSSKFAIQPRIVKGNNAVANQFPYQISLQMLGSHLCGGSIITQNYIVTAAHCVTIDGDPNNKIPVSIMTIRAGSHLVNSGGVVIGVSETKAHPNYSKLTNDIAVLKLSKPLQFNDSIKPIALATQSLKVGTALVTSGWGRLYTNGPGPEILKHITLKAISTAECKRRVVTVPTSVVCLVPFAGRDICQGDSGGPAVYNNKLYGLTSISWGTCGSDKPNGFTRIVPFVNWIKNNTDL